MRKIIHIDADCFFAALEMRDNPKLANCPIAVGGSAARRGVISTCNYPARKFGVRSAMATAYALRLCPLLKLLPHRFDVYKQASQAMREIFLSYTAVIDPVSLDEAYLDVSCVEHCMGSATLIAKEIRQKVERDLGITVSAGVANNKFLAKVASDWQKPNGLTVITPDQNDSFSLQLPIEKLYSVGKVTAERLHGLGLYRCKDLREFGFEPLVRRFGHFGVRLFECASGLDERPVVSSRERKSISVEHTFARDIAASESLLALPKLLAALHERVERARLLAMVSKLFVKVKFADFNVTTVERRAAALDDLGFEVLLAQATARSAQAIRLLGVGIKVERAEVGAQLPLFNGL